MDNYLGNTLSSAGAKAQYDANVKALLSDKQILAWILKYATSEFSNMTIQSILPLIEEPLISSVPVMPGRSQEAITGLPQESSIPNEGVLTYDIRFYVSIPDEKPDEPLHLIINIEA